MISDWKIPAHLHVKVDIPMFEEITFHVVVTNDIHKAHNDLKVPISAHCVAEGGETHMDDGSTDIYLFVGNKYLTHDWIGHELFHVVSCILGKTGIHADTENDEAAARIAGFLHRWTYKQIEKLGLKVTH